jgi:mannose/fructose/N-acetylgalactosamine-specific phosphotransferase system component IIC
MILIGSIVLGSTILLDKFAFGEFGISQPIMAGALLGAVFGDLQSGILIGAGLQLIFLGGLPIGRDIPPDGQAAGIIGCLTYFIMKTAHPQGQALLAAVLLALFASLCGGAMEIIARRLNERFARKFRKTHTHLPVYHLLGITTAFVRGICLTTPFVLLAVFVPLPKQFPHLDPSLFMIITSGIGAAHGLYLFVKRSSLPYILIGGLCGLALLVL